MSNSASRKQGRDFIFHDAGTGAGAGAVGDFAFLDRLRAANVDADGGIELERATAGRGFGVAEHHDDFFANLIDEDDGGAAFCDSGGELAHRLAHEAGLEATMSAIAHLAFNFGTGIRAGDGVDHDHVHGVGADEQLADFQGLLAGVGLGDHEIVELDAEPLGPGGIEGVLGIDEGSDAATLLGVGDDVETERRLAGRFRPEDFEDSAAGNADAAEGDVEGQRAGGDAVGGGAGGAVELHDGAFAELLFDLLDGAGERGIARAGSRGASLGISFMTGILAAALKGRSSGRGRLGSVGRRGC